MGGIFGTISKKSCVADLFYGTDYNSHLGTRRGGLATYSSEKGFVRSIHNLESSYFRTKFEPTLNKFEGATSGIGVISDTDAQPLIMNSHLGRFAICTVAKIVNKDELTQYLLDKNMHFAEMSSGSTNPTELVALLIIQGKTFREGIENVFHHIKGSCTMMILTEDGIICARDSWGRTPIIIGKKDGAYAASSETTSFPNLDYETEYELGPGEIVKITADKMEQLRPANKKMQVCSFLWVYYGFPTSTYEGKNVEEARFTNGFNLAKSDDVEVDCCSGIPDSGTGMAMGYAAGKGVPYQRCIAKYTPTWPRSFTPSNQSMRSLVAKMKLIPNKVMLKGKRVLFCDDSIVRGTQLRDNVKVLFDQAGLKECHMRIACPPLVYGCPFINFTSSKSDMELITRRIIEKFEGDANKKMQVCSFLWVYYGFPTSTYEGKNVEEARFTNGFNLAKTDDVEVDCCSGIPDSGTGMAMGYAAGKGVPYQRCIAKYTPTWPRSFTPSNQSMRSLVAKMKLIPNKAMLKGKRVLFCDDSIVRGTQLRDNVKVLFDQAGLKECHMRIACPPLVYGCPFINFTSSKSDMELITRRIIEKFEGDANKNLEKYATTGSPEYQRMVDEIASQLGLTSLKFNTIEQLVEAIGLPKCQVCTHCFDGSSAYTLNEFADED